MNSNQNKPNLSTFLMKLWQMIEKPENHDLIRWSADGTSFLIQNQARFWHDLLPKYFKHNNMSSFIRQLNLYGFYKVNNILQDSDQENAQIIQFQHANFRRNHPELVRQIHRKATPRTSETDEEITALLEEVKQLKSKQEIVDQQLAAMKEENCILWREMANLRERHHKQQEIVNNLIKFLISMMHSLSSRVGTGKRPRPLMLSERSKMRRVSSDSHKMLSVHQSQDNSPEEVVDHVDQETTENVPLVSSPEPIASTSNWHNNQLYLQSESPDCFLGSTINLEAATISNNSSATSVEPPITIESGEELNSHLGSCQTELDQFKDILNNGNMDANELLGLFGDIDPVPNATSETDDFDFSALLDDALNGGAGQPSTSSTPAILPKGPQQQKEN